MLRTKLSFVKRLFAKNTLKVQTLNKNKAIMLFWTPNRRVNQFVASKIDIKTSNSRHFTEV